MMLRHTIVLKQICVRGATPLYAPSVALCSPDRSFLPKPPRRGLQTMKTVASLPEKPEPWPYKELGYTTLHYLADYSSKKRYDERTKYFVVEGNLGTGKAALAEDLAKAFDFHYVRDPSMDDILINSYGSDLRDHYDKLPTPCRIFDAKRFLENPTHANATMFQFFMYFIRTEATLNALAHLTNTGQGVIQKRSFRSDFVFMEAMHKKGYVSPNFRKWYLKLQESMEPFVIHQPHVVIYLDCPPEKCLENIRKRGNPSEINGKAIDLDYLKAIDFWYKNRYLPSMRRTSYVLVYDVSEGYESDIIAEDIEGLDLDPEEFDQRLNELFAGWFTLEQEPDWADERRKYTQKHEVLRWFQAPAWECPDILWHPDDWEKLYDVVTQYHEGKFQHGFNLDKGDSLWKILLRGGMFQRGARHSTQNWIEFQHKDGWGTLAAQKFY